MISHDLHVTVAYQHGFDRGHEASPDAQGLLESGGRPAPLATPLGEHPVHHVSEVIGRLEGCIGIGVQSIQPGR